MSSADKLFLTMQRVTLRPPRGVQRSIRSRIEGFYRSHAHWLPVPWIAVAWLAWGTVAAADDPLPKITSIRVGGHADYDRVVFQLDGEAAATHGREGSGLVIEIAARPSGSARFPSPLPSRIGSARLRETPAGTRIDFGSRPERVRAFLLSDPPRIVVDFAGPGSEPFELPAGLKPLPQRAALAPKPKPQAPRETAVSPEAPACAETCADIVRQGELRPDFDLRTCVLEQCLRAANDHKNSGRREQSLVELDYLVKNGGDVRAYKLRGVVLFDLGRYPEAAETFDAVLENAPSDPFARSMRAQALARSGRLEAAKAEFQALLALPTTQGRDASYLRTHLGLVELQLGEIAAGRRDLEAAARLDPSNATAPGALEMIPYLESGVLTPSGLGDMLAFHEARSTGRIEAADAALGSLNASSPDFALGYVLRAGFLAANGREPECDESLRRLMAKYPDDVGLRFASYHCTILRYGPESSQGIEAVHAARELAAAHPENEVGASLVQWLEE